MATFHSEPQNIQWLLLLLNSIAVALFSVAIPNLYRQKGNPRPHNGLKLFNDCLARHQLAYLAYFLALLTVANFDVIWTKNLLHVLIVFSFGFYTVGVALSTDQDSKIAEYHACSDPNAKCTNPFRFRDRGKVCAWNIVFATILFTAGMVLAFMVK